MVDHRLIKIVIPIFGTYYRLTHSFKRNKNLTVFCFHDVTNQPSEFDDDYGLNVTPEIFEIQLSLIQENFSIITPDDLLEDSIPENSALITFDDGFKGFFQNAIPILEKYNIPALIFLNMGAIKGEIFWAGLLTFLCKTRPDFLEQLKERSTGELVNPPFLACSKKDVECYLENNNEDFKYKVSKYVGNFATVEDLQYASTNKLIYFGNHLFNHYVPLLMTDEELVDSFKKNENLLKKYPNYRNMFSFPFGQPESCFSKKQLDTVQKHCTSYIFYSSGRINLSLKSPWDRIALSSAHKKQSQIWFQIYFRSLFDIFFKRHSKLEYLK
jgi:hypothetical protein